LLQASNDIVEVFGRDDDVLDARAQLVTNATADGVYGERREHRAEYVVERILHTRTFAVR